MKFKIHFIYIVCICNLLYIQNIYSYKELSFEELLNLSIKNTSFKVFQTIRYSNLYKISKYNISKFRDSESSLREILTNNQDKNFKTLIKSINYGLINKDPKVRLYCINLLLYLKPSIKEISDPINRIYDSNNIYSETTTKKIEYYDIFYIKNISTVKNALDNLILSYKEVFIKKTEDKKYIYLQISPFLDYNKYEVYINDTLFYQGKKNIFIKRKSNSKNKILVYYYNNTSNIEYKVD